MNFMFNIMEDNVAGNPESESSPGYTAVGDVEPDQV